MTKIALVYGTSTGTTETVAKRIQSALGNVTLFDAAEVSVDDLTPFNYFIFGASTTGMGDLQDDWDVLLPQVSKMNFDGKIVALFALGDSASFSTSFAGSMRQIYDALNGKVDIVGAVSTDGYTFENSEAVVKDRFVGLPLDEDNEYNETEKRIANWVVELKKHFV